MRLSSEVCLAAMRWSALLQGADGGSLCCAGRSSPVASELDASGSDAKAASARTARPSGTLGGGTEVAAGPDGASLGFGCLLGAAGEAAAGCVQPGASECDGCAVDDAPPCLGLLPGCKLAALVGAGLGAAHGCGMGCERGIERTAGGMAAAAEARPSGRRAGQMYWGMTTMLGAPCPGLDRNRGCASMTGAGTCTCLPGRGPCLAACATAAAAAACAGACARHCQRHLACQRAGRQAGRLGLEVTAAGMGVTRLVNGIATGDSLCHRLSGQHSWHLTVGTLEQVAYASAHLVISSSPRHRCRGRWVQDDYSRGLLRVARARVPCLGGNREGWLGS